MFWKFNSVRLVFMNIQFWDLFVFESSVGAEKSIAGAVLSNVIFLVSVDPFWLTLSIRVTL